MYRNMQYLAHDLASLLNTPGWPFIGNFSRGADGRGDIKMQCRYLDDWIEKKERNYSRILNLQKKTIIQTCPPVYRVDGFQKDQLNCSVLFKKKCEKLMN